MTAPPAPGIRPMLAADARPVGELLALAFSDKTPSIVGRRRALAPVLLADLALASRDAWLAEVDGEVAGVVIFQGAARRWWVNVHWSLLRRWLPPAAALRAAAFQAVFHSVDLGPEELYLDTLAVHPRHEGQGIGAALLRFADDEARRRGRRAVTLYCISRNERARELYLRHGYRVIEREDLWWCAFVLGFRFTDKMLHDVPGG